MRPVSPRLQGSEADTSPTPSIAAVAVEFPPHQVGQQEALSGLTGFGGPQFDRFGARSGVQTRRIALPLPQYGKLSGFTEANDIFIETALELGERVPLFGLGCVAGAAGVARMHDYLLAFPDHVSVLLAVELCSLTLQRDDYSIANLVATSLFGDGAGAVVAKGAGRTPAGPRILATRSRLYPDTEDVMGWNIGSNGFQIK